MDEINILKEIETSYPVQDIKINGIQIWPYLRNYIGDQLFFQKDRRVKLDSRLYKNVLKYWLYGFFSLFKKYDYFFFSSSNQRRIIDGKYYDRLDTIADLTGKGLFFELPTPFHYKKKELYTKNIVSKYFLHIWEYIISKFLFKKHIEGEQLYENITRKLNIEIELRPLCTRFLSQYKTAKRLFGIYKPKAVFITNSYNNMPYVKAFKDCGIKVIEIQHGVINSNHFAYNVFRKFDSGLYPDILLTLGEIERNVFTDGNYFIDKDNVIPVGHFYLDYINTSTTKDPKIAELESNYEKVVTFTMQDGFEDKIIPFIKKLAEINRNVAYIFVPRSKISADYEKYKLPSNIVFMEWLNCYELMAHTKYHATVNSTCALEAPSLGCRNILINLDNRAKDYYEQVLNNEKITLYVHTPEEFIEALYKVEDMHKRTVIESNQKIIAPDYINNIKKVLGIIK